MLSWLRNRSRHRTGGRHALRGEVDRNRREIEGLKAQSAALRNQLASLAAGQMAEASEPALPPPPPQLAAAAGTYCPRGRAVYLTTLSGHEHVVTTDGHGDPVDWWAYLNSPRARQVAS